jgi:hypothetical protein
MKTSRTGRLSAGLTFVLAGAALVGIGQTVRADSPVSATQKAQGAFFPRAATVKLDTAMLQEQTVGPDGIVRTETYLDALPNQSAKASVPLVKKSPAAVKA